MYPHLSFVVARPEGKLRKILEEIASNLENVDVAIHHNDETLEIIKAIDRHSTHLYNQHASY